MFGVIGFGVFVGLLSAVFGVGGGIVMVPFMVLVLDETQHVADAREPGRGFLSMGVGNYLSIVSNESARRTERLPRKRSTR